MRAAKSFLTLSFLLLLNLAALAVSVKDGRGKTITLNAFPKRIVSLTPSNTEILFAIGAGSKVVGDTAQCNFPADALKLPKVGDFEISVEKVVALKPDLVIAHSLLNVRVIPALEKIGVPVFAGDPASLQQVMDFINSVGAITGEQKGAEKVVTRMKKGIAYVKSLASKVKTQPRVLFTAQATPLWVAGSGTFLDEMTRLAGGKNVGGASPKFYEASVEAIIVQDPQFIFASHDDPQVYQRLPAWKSVSAVKNKKIYVLDGDLFNRTGPRLVQALQSLYFLLHPLNL